MKLLRLRVPLLGLALAAACARAPQGRHVDLAPVPAPRVIGCERCGAEVMPPEVTRAIELRIADLAARGASCSMYGEVLERSYRERRISIRPFMWRVGTRLVSGEARADGEMVLAREIDSLNVGLRTVDDLIWTAEHEAAHIAFNISSGNESNEARVNAFVRECNGAHASASAKGNAKSPRER